MRVGTLRDLLGRLATDIEDTLADRRRNGAGCVLQSGLAPLRTHEAVAAAMGARAVDDSGDLRRNPLADGTDDDLRTLDGEHRPCGRVTAKDASPGGSRADGRLRGSSLAGFGVHVPAIRFGERDAPADVDELIINVNIGHDNDACLESLERFAAEVMPSFAGGRPAPRFRI